MVRVINIPLTLEPILGFLYPTYTYTDGLTKFRNFITHYDVQSTHERELLDHSYENAVIISTRIFDELYSVDTMKSDVLAFVAERFRCRKKKLELTATEPEQAVWECVRFMFMSGVPSGVGYDIDELFRSFGSRAFLGKFIQFSEEVGPQRARATFETYITKVLSDSNTIYYKRAQQRILQSLRENLETSISDIRLIDPYFASNHPDLVSMRLFTMLMRKEYYG